MVVVEEDFRVMKIKGNYDKVQKEEELMNYTADKKTGSWIRILVWFDENRKKITKNIHGSSPRIWS
jgi:hypothetical protein